MTWVVGSGQSSIGSIWQWLGWSSIGSIDCVLAPQSMERSSIGSIGRRSMILNSIGSIGRHHTLLLQRLSSIGSIGHHRTSMLRLSSIGSIVRRHSWVLVRRSIGSIGLGLLELET